MNTKYTTLGAIASMILLASCTSDVVNDVQEATQNTVDVVAETGTEIIDSSQELTSMEKKEEEGVMVGGAMMVESKDIVDNAVNSEDHTTLVAAVTAAGLVDTLKSEGPFTVFAPTNTAFDELPAGTVDTLLMEENKADLTAVLTYHVIPGKIMAEDLEDGLTAETVQGDMVTFTYENDMWMINGAKIEIANAVSSNGVTHVIDTVLVPNTGE